MSMKVISISLLKNKRQCKVGLDNGEQLNVSTDLALKYTLSKGRILDESTIEIINSEQRLISAKSSAYNYASYKPRTIRQVNERLKQKGFENSEITSAIEFLKQFDLLDDIKYCKSFIENTLLRKPIGKSKLFMELLKRGIDKDLATESIHQYFPENESMDLAKKSADKKMRMLRTKPIEKQKSSLIAHLQRHGFSYEIIKQVVAEYIG